MARPKSYWRKPIYDSDKALENAQEIDFKTAPGRLNAGQNVFDLWKHYNDFMAHEKFYQDTNSGMERKNILGHIREQLAPGQRVGVLFDGDANAVWRIERPGDGYLEADGKLKYFQLEGENENGICRATLRPETTHFDVTDREGHKEIDLADFYQPPREDRWEAARERPERNEHEHFSKKKQESLP